MKTRILLAMLMALSPMMMSDADAWGGRILAARARWHANRSAACSSCAASMGYRYSTPVQSTQTYSYVVPGSTTVTYSSRCAGCPTCEAKAAAAMAGQATDCYPDPITGVMICPNVRPSAPPTATGACECGCQDQIDALKSRVEALERKCAYQSSGVLPISCAKPATLPVAWSEKRLPISWAKPSKLDQRVAMR